MLPEISILHLILLMELFTRVCKSRDRFVKGIYTLIRFLSQRLYCFWSGNWMFSPESYLESVYTGLLVVIMSIKKYVGYLERHVFINHQLVFSWDETWQYRTRCCQIDWFASQLSVFLVVCKAMAIEHSLWDQKHCLGSKK